MSTRTRRRVARKPHPACGGYCPTIQPGDVYLECIAFPGDDVIGSESFWRIRECAECATRYGRGHLLEPLPAEQAARLAHVPTGPCGDRGGRP